MKGGVGRVKAGSGEEWSVVEAVKEEEPLAPPRIKKVSVVAPLVPDLRATMLTVKATDRLLGRAISRELPSKYKT